MSEFKKGDRIKYDTGDLCGTGTVTVGVSRFGNVAFVPDNAAEYYQKYPSAERRGYGQLPPSYIEPLAPETPTPGAIVDVTRKTVTKTVEEEVVEYPEFPARTVLADRHGVVMEKSGNGKWYLTGSPEPENLKVCDFPVTVLRYGKGDE